MRLTKLGQLRLAALDTPSPGKGRVIEEGVEFPRRATRRPRHPPAGRQETEEATSPITSPITKFTEIAKARGDSILEAHRRVRRAVRTTGVTQRIDHKPPVDVLGVYVYLPTDGGR